MASSLLQVSNPFEKHANDVMDLYAWFWLQGWFMPYYIIGKQDQWKDWVGSTLNGWRISNLCQPK